MDWWTHDRLINYDQPNPAENDISQWLIQNPQRANLARIGILFDEDDVTEDVLGSKSQTLDLWSGKISSSFTYKGEEVQVETWSDSESDTVAISVQSRLLSNGTLGVFFDFPLPTRNKFEAPFVGIFNATANHSTSITSTERTASIRHDLDDTTYFTSIGWDTDAGISGPIENTHRYVLEASNGTETLQMTVSFSPKPDMIVTSFDKVSAASTKWWNNYWSSGAFVDLSSSSLPNATEIQRITILSQYLVAVNSASSNSPQG